MHRKIVIITAEEMEERVESVQVLKEDKISFAEEDESSSVGTKTDGELVENNRML